MQRRNTEQRNAVWQTAASMYHPSADDVYRALKERLPGIGRTTVFRNLAILVESGRLKRVEIPNEPVRYDADTSGHSHFVCRVCGKITDLPFVPDVEIPKIAGGMVESCAVTYYGLCPDCGNKKNYSERQIMRP